MLYTLHKTNQFNIMPSRRTFSTKVRLILARIDSQLPSSS